MCYLRESKSYLFYLYAISKNEIQICSNKHETGLVDAPRPVVEKDKSMTTGATVTRLLLLFQKLRLTLAKKRCDWRCTRAEQNFVEFLHTFYSRFDCCQFFTCVNNYFRYLSCFPISYDIRLPAQSVCSHMFVRW